MNLKKTCIAIVVASALIGNTMVAQAAKQTFDGTAKPLITATLGYGTNDVYRCIVNYIARPGMILHGPTYDANGNVVKPGDLLASMTSRYNESLVENAKAQIKIAEANLAFQEKQYNRYKTLSATKAASLEDYQNYASQYFQAIATRDSAKSSLIAREVQLELCHYRAEFDCIVDAVLLPWGVLAGERNIITISQIDPIGIEVKMDVSLARKITPQTPVAVYPINSNKPVGVWNLGIIQTPDGVIFRAGNNSTGGTNVNKDGKEVPTVNCLPAYRLYSQMDPIIVGVPVKSIYKDETGTYVWKAVGESTVQPGKGINKFFPVQKVYLEKGNVVRNISDFVMYTSFTTKDQSITIAEGDLVLVDPPENLKDNDTVCYFKEVYQFMPGDKVKVEITF